MATPFDRRILWVHWMGDKVGEKTIEQLAATVKKYSPTADGIVIKTSDGPLWQGVHDTNALMAVRGLQSIQSWVQTLNAYQLETHLWCTLRGRNADAEANLVIQACRVPGIKSMRLDLNVSDWYASGLSAEVARAEAQKIRAGLGPGIHLAVSFDPRGSQPARVHLDEWAAHVQSLHPRVFHWEYSEGLRGPEEYLDEVFTALAKYNLPIVPILQTFKDPATQNRVPENDIFDAGGYALQKGAPGLSFFRLGEAGPTEFRGVTRIQIDAPVTSSTVQPTPAAPMPPSGAAAPATPVPASEPARPVIVTPPTELKSYVVTTQNLNVRSGPGTEPRLKIAGQQLSQGQVIRVRPDSRVDDDGYIWIQLENGWWIAEKTSDGREVFIAEAPAAAPAAPAAAGNVYMVITGNLRVRTAPAASASEAGERLAWGAQVAVDPASRTEADGLVWWKHAQGWSAERTVGGSETFMIPYDPNADQRLPETPFKFERLPVGLDVMQWFYYYGNTVYAFNNGRRWNYDAYAQGLHAGLDFGHPGGATIYAGVTGIFEGPGRAFGPNRVDVIVGDYRIVYGHLADPASYAKGSEITPDMPVGKIDANLQHLHLEIRHKDTTIINTLAFLTKEMRDGIIAKFPPVGQFGFYQSPRWQKWLTPFDQPTIVLGGPVIGPRATS